MSKTTLKLSTLSAAILLASGIATPAYAAEEIGTIELGTSKRAVQTGTANAVTVVEAEEMADRQASTIAELVDSVPGVTLINGSTPAGSAINIRGYGANSTFGNDQKIQIMVDNATTGAEELYRMGTQLFTDPFLFKSVTVSRGTAGSFEYGSGIVGGIVKLETKDASDLTGGEAGTRVGVTVGAYDNGNGISTSTTVATMTEDGVELLANYATRKQDNQDDGAGAEIGNGAFDLPSYLLKAKMPVGAGILSTSYTDTNSSEKDVAYNQFDASSSSGFKNVDRDTQQQATNIEYSLNPADNDLLNLTLAYSQANLAVDMTPVDNNDCREYNHQTRTYGAVDLSRCLYNVNHEYVTTKYLVKNNSFIEVADAAHDIRYGVEFIDKDRADMYSAPGGSDRRTAFFIVDDIEMTDGLTVTPAARYETQKIVGDNGDIHKNSAWMGGLAVVYATESGWAPYASVADTVALPILDDLGSSKIETSEKSSTTEYGVSFEDNQAFNGEGRLSAKLSAYETKLKDITTYSGINSIDTNGFELEMSVAMLSGVYMDFNASTAEGTATYASATSGINDFDWQQIPQDSIRVGLGKKFANGLDVSAELIAAQKKTQLKRVYSGGSYTASNVTYDAYEVVNLRATYQLSEETTIRASIENAGDTEYKPSLSTRNAPGRNVKIAISHLF